MRNIWPFEVIRLAPDRFLLHADDQKAGGYLVSPLAFGRSVLKLFYTRNDCAKIKGIKMKILHVGRSWAGMGNPLEAKCPCPKESCGLVALDRAASECTQHAIIWSKTMRQVHTEDACPGAPTQISSTHQRVLAIVADRLMPADGETIAVPRALLAGIFDLAVNTLDFGSGFWDDDDVRTGRAVAELLGVDPLEGTPLNYRKRMVHPFKPAKLGDECHWCILLPDADVHQPTPATTPGATDAP